MSAGLEIYLGGIPRTKPTADGGVWLDGVRMEATGRLVYIDRKEWSAWPPLNDPKIAEKSIRNEAQRQLDALPPGAQLEWQMSNPDKADVVRELLSDQQKKLVVIKVVAKP